MTDDLDLLREFVENASEAALAALVRRRIDFVYNVALRRTGDAHLASDVTQRVFLDLTRKARPLLRRPELVSWLYTSTRYAAAQAARTQHRWRKREEEIHTMEKNLEANAASEPDWNAIRPVLDAALEELNEGDRTALLLRFFEGRSLGDVGKKLGVAENAARMRVNRALERLRVRLAKRGIVSTVAALGSTLASQPVTTAPLGLAAVTSAGAMAGLTAVNGSAAGILSLLSFLSGAKAGLAVVVLLATGGFAIYRHEAMRIPREVPHVLPSKTQSTTRTSPVAEGAIESGNTVEDSQHQRTLAALGEIFGEADEARALALYTQRLHDLELGDFSRELFDLRDRNFSERQERFIAMLLKSWIELDPANALASEIQRAGENGKYIDPLLRGWATHSPADALAWVQASIANLSDDGVVRSRFHSLFVAAVETKDFARALSLGALVPGAVDSSLLAEAWSAVDPVAASAWVLGLPPSGQRAAALSGFVRSIVSSDPDLANSVIRGLSDPLERARVWSAAFALEPPNGDKTLRVALLADLVGRNENGAYDSIIEDGFIHLAILPADAEAARALVALVKDEHMQRYSAKSLVESVRASAPTEAITTAIEFLKNSEKDGIIESIILNWQNSDLGAAVDFLRNSPKIPESMRSRLVLIAETGGTDP